MEKGKQVMGNGVSGEKAVKKKNLILYPVEPNSSGKGLPYAPADWPNPGDTWRWWVGKRMVSSGFYTDRFVHLPKRLRAYGAGWFPLRNIAVVKISYQRGHWSHLRGIKKPPWNSKMTKKARPATSQAFPRRSTRQSNKIPAQNNTRSVESVIDLCYLTDDSTSDGSGYSKCDSEPQIDLEDVAPNQSIGSSCYASKDFELQDVQNVQEPHAQFCEEDFHDFLKSVEHILSQHNDRAQVRTPSTCAGSDMAEEMSTHRKKLSSILALDFSCMLSSEYLEQITFSVEKLVADPILTVDHLLKLKLVEEIPKAGEVFQRTKGLADQASDFFGELQAMKYKAASIKKEFSERKKEAREFQSQIDSKSPLVREIDEQIAQLQSRKAELTHDLESTNKAKAQVVAEQKIVANSISAVMREIQTASAEIPVWEMKKKNAEKRMAEILDRYAPLKGFSFEKSS
ncbi:hypothetical protein NL676_020961 [Syzygium grande]|nr:hypothetical protein NL676_020961 [Syzygium grande]